MSAAPKSELPSHVGQAEFAAARDMLKRQIQRSMARGKFPKPVAPRERERTSEVEPMQAAKGHYNRTRTKLRTEVRLNMSIEPSW